MKLKSKLIATIVSMCAAIAVMGVGVWASTSQSFQVTVKNDIDVKILSVDADIYGEFAVYSQFIGHTTSGETNTFAQYYQNTNTGTDHLKNGSADGDWGDRYTRDHGYLLYASDQGGYNDGRDGVTQYYAADGTKHNAEKDKSYVGWYNTNVNALANTGYYKYITEAKQHVYFATARSAGIDYDGDETLGNFTLAEDLASSSFDRPEGWAEDRYNIDYTTHVAQITYMYTIRQWKMASATAATNAIDIALSDATNGNLNQKLTNAAGNAGVYIDAYITRATDESATENQAVNAAGKTTAGNYSWYPISLTNPTRLPESTINQTYYIVLTYTFARNSANLDLEGLGDAVEHRIVMASKGELQNATQFTGGIYAAEAQAYNAGTAVRLNYATGLSDKAGVNNALGKVSENGYNVVGSEFNPNFSPERAMSTMSKDQRSTVFAAYKTAANDLEKDNDLEVDTLTHSNILGILNGAVRASNAPRGGYIFASNLTKQASGDTFEPIIIADSDEETAEDHQSSEGSTAWYVRELVEGRTVPAYTHTTHSSVVQ